MATIAIGDIHGQVKPLHDLLERVRPNVTGDTVVFLGDYIDRGRETRACIDAILEFSASVPAEIVYLRGNHEEWMLETRDDDDWPHPRIFGATYGLDTIAHGVLTAVRLPGPYVLQSARYERCRG